MTPPTIRDERDKSHQSGALAKLDSFIRSERKNLAVNLLASAIWWPVPVLLSLFWDAIVSAAITPMTLLAALRTDIRVSAWILPTLFLLPLVLLHLCWYVRLYRYRADTFFGLDFTWLYSFPMGRVIRVRAHCPHCRKSAPEPTGILDRFDNYLCRNCDYNTQSRGAERVEYPWLAAIQRRVLERRCKARAS